MATSPPSARPSATRPRRPSSLAVSNTSEWASATCSGSEPNRAQRYSNEPGPSPRSGCAANPSSASDQYAERLPAAVVSRTAGSDCSTASSCATESPPRPKPSLPAISATTTRPSDSAATAPTATPTPAGRSRSCRGPSVESARRRSRVEPRRRDERRRRHDPCGGRAANQLIAIAITRTSTTHPAPSPPAPVAISGCERIARIVAVVAAVPTQAWTVARRRSRESATTKRTTHAAATTPPREYVR